METITLHINELLNLIQTISADDQPPDADAEEITEEVEICVKRSE